MLSPARAPDPGRTRADHPLDAPRQPESRLRGVEAPAHGAVSALRAEDAEQGGAGQDGGGASEEDADGRTLSLA